MRMFDILHNIDLFTDILKFSGIFVHFKLLVYFDCEQVLWVLFLLFFLYLSVLGFFCALRQEWRLWPPNILYFIYCYCRLRVIWIICSSNLILFDILSIQLLSFFHGTLNMTYLYFISCIMKLHFHGW